MSGVKRCFIEAIELSEIEHPIACEYLEGKLHGVFRTAGNVPGEVVECDRCLTAFRLNAGGVHVESVLDCDVPECEDIQQHDYIGAVGRFLVQQ